MFFQLCLTTFSSFFAFSFCLTLLLSVPFDDDVNFPSRCWIRSRRRESEREKAGESECRGKVFVLATKLLIVMIFLLFASVNFAPLSPSLTHSFDVLTQPVPHPPERKKCMREKTMKISPRISRWKARLDTFLSFSVEEKCLLFRG